MDFPLKARVYPRPRQPKPFAPPGMKAFSFGGQTVVLRKAPPRKSKRFVPKTLISPQMWREMLKKTPPKMKAKKAKKEEREAMKEVVLRAEKTIRIATRDRLDEYCKDYAREGLPGKKNKPKKVKTKTHEDVHAPAKCFQPEILYKKSKRNVNFTVQIERFEEYDHNFTIKDKYSTFPPGQYASFTLRLDGEADVEMPEQKFEEIEVETTINVCGDDRMEE